MKSFGKHFCVFLVGVTISLPVASHSVTLPGSLQTPCYFGAMGGTENCIALRSGNQARVAQQSTSKAVTPSATTVAAVSPVSTVFTPSPIVPASKVSPTQSVNAVPIPLAGLLLLGSLGLMVFANRKRA